MHSLMLLLSQNQDTASAFSSNHDCFQTMSFLKWNIFTENVLLNASSETCTTFYAVVLHPWWSNDFWPLLHGHGDSGNSGTVCSLLKLSWSSLSLKIPDPQFCDAQNHWLWPSLYFSNLVSFFLTCSTCGIILTFMFLLIWIRSPLRNAPLVKSFFLFCWITFPSKICFIHDFPTFDFKIQQ